jgi:hypothetical protein
MQHQYVALNFPTEPEAAVGVVANPVSAQTLAVAVYDGRTWLGRGVQCGSTFFAFTTADRLVGAYASLAAAAEAVAAAGGAVP